MLTVMSSPSLDTEHSDTVRTVSLTEEPLEQNAAKSCVPQNFKSRSVHYCLIKSFRNAQ